MYFTSVLNIFHTISISLPYHFTKQDHVFLCKQPPPPAPKQTTKRHRTAEARGIEQAAQITDQGTGNLVGFRGNSATAAEITQANHQLPFEIAAKCSTNFCRKPPNYKSLKNGTLGRFRNLGKIVGLPWDSNHH